jgi:hypothetical protein
VEPPTAAPSLELAELPHRICGHLDQTTCDAAIAAVIGNVPDVGGWSPAVAETFSPDGKLNRRNEVVLVAFRPAPDVDVWMSPPTWIVTRASRSVDWAVRPWTFGPLPAHFQTLIDTPVRYGAR